MTPGFQIKGADGPIQIPPGQFYFNTKARCRNLMSNKDLSRSARQVYASLELATMGWQSELAVIQEKDEQRPLTTTDIARQTLLDESDVRRSLDELQDAGLAERRSRNGGSLTKGNVEIYSWAQPKPTSESRTRAPGKLGEDPDWLPESWQALTRFVKRTRRSIPQDFPLDDPHARTLLLQRGEQVARVLEMAEKEAARFWDEVNAQSRPNKEERTETTIERTSSSAVPEVDSETTTTEPTPEPEQPPERTVPPEPEPVQTLSSEVVQSAPTPESDVKIVETQLGIDNDAARKIVRETRWVRPDATALEIVYAALKKAKELRGGFQNGRYDNMTGLLIRAIPKMAASDLWLHYRDELKQQTLEEAEREVLNE